MSTDRLLLRGWRESDREPFAALNADPEVTEFLLGPMTRAESDAMVDRIEASFAAKGYGLWAVEVVGGPEFVGYVGLWDPTFEAPFTPAVEIGWRLARSAWGHGYATEGAQAALRYAFGTVGLAEVVSFTAAVNVRSRAVMERLGMTRDPDEDFDHPRVAVDSPLHRHVLYRLASTAAPSTARASHQASSSS
ncbi:GNAT family N-acetyltransferase [Sporichthya brevicatena]|uniref:GNAT family N-acetyltransferase n=1 Tax=Sporichthya brevicatena TaxID=171442 RepID=A0ABP3SGS8_9ACTN